MARDSPPKRQSYRAGASFGALSFLIVGFIALCSSVVIGRVYGLTVIGAWALVMAPSNAAWFLSSMRERPALVRELTKLEPRAPRVTGLFAAVLAASVGLTVVVGGLGLVATYFIFRGPLGHPELFGEAALAMAGYVVITNTCFNVDTILAGFRAGRPLFWLRLHQAASFLAFTLAFGLISDTPAALVWAGIVSQTTSLVHRLVVLRSYMRFRVEAAVLRDGLTTLPGIIRFGLKIAPGGVADGIANESATWVLAAVGGGLGHLGAYNRAWSLARRVQELNFRVNEMLFPTLLERRANGDHVGYARALVDSSRYIVAGLLLPAAAAGGAAGSLMEVLFGREFRTASGAMAALLVMPALSALSVIQRHALYTVERPWTATASATIRMVTTLATSVALTIALGTTGPALAILCGFAADLAFMFHRVRPWLHAPWLTLVPLRRVLAIPAAYAAAFLAAHAVAAVLAPFPGLCAALVVGSIVYVATLVACGGIGPADRARAAELRRQIRGRRARRAPAPVVVGKN
jgi:O-antigen/teichoic acid export membrane protein